MPGREPLQKKGSQGNRKLRNTPKTQKQIEFYCVSCKTNKRMRRKLENLCLIEMPNGSYNLTDLMCSTCKHRATKFVSKKYGEELKKLGVKACQVKDKIKKILKK